MSPVGGRGILFDGDLCAGGLTPSSALNTQLDEMRALLAQREADADDLNAAFVELEERLAVVTAERDEARSAEQEHVEAAMQGCKQPQHRRVREPQRWRLSPVRCQQRWLRRLSAPLRRS